MTGPQHYREAEALIDSADSLPRSRDGGMDPLADHLIATAQVHATLALAAATATLDAAEGPGGGSATGRTAEDWKASSAALDGEVSA